MAHWYIREGGEVRPAADVWDYLRWKGPDGQDEAKIQVVRDVFFGGTLVSTVFLGLNHNHDHGPPVVFETMIFNGPDPAGEYQERYCTEAEARAGHEAACRTVAPAAAARLAAAAGLDFGDDRFALADWLRERGESRLAGLLADPD